MERTGLNRIQIQILLYVRDEDGRTATETLYDLVEEARPTVDEDGEQLDEDVDIYQTSREEIGALENAGILAQDDEGMAAGGYSSFTDAGRKLADELAESTPGAEETLRELAEVLWPEGDADHEWSPDTIDEVARILTDVGFRPAAE